MIPTAHPTPSLAPRAAGPLLVAVVALVAILPPEVHGSALAGAAALVALAALLSPLATGDAVVVCGAVGTLALASRFAQAPGESVEPAALVALALAAGFATARLRPGADFLGAPAAALVAALGLRALYEALFGLDAMADVVRGGAAIADAGAVLNRLEQGRAYGGFSTPAALAGFLALLLPAAAAWAASRRGSLRIAGLAACGAGLAGLVASRSLTALAALGGALLLAGARRRISAKVLATALAATAVVVLGVALARPDSVFSFSGPDSPWRLRTGNVRIAVEIARDHPWIGVGPGGYAEMFPSHRTATDNESKFAHDLPAQLLAEWGVPAGAAWGAAFLILFLGPLLSRRAALREPEGALALGLAAFALHNLADFTAFLPSFAVATAVMRGAIARPRSEPSNVPPRVAFAAAAIVAAVAAGLSGLSRDALFDARDAAAAGDRGRARDRALQATRLAPWDCDARLAAAQSRDAATERAAALEDADAAVRAAPVRAAARAVRAELRAASGDIPGAYADLVRAASLYPANRAYAARRDDFAGALAGAGTDE